MNKLKLLPLIAPTAVAVIAPTISCAPGKITGDWTEFIYNKESKPTYQSKDTINLKANKKYTASFTINAPKEDLESSKYLGIVIQNGSDVYSWGEEYDAQLWFGKKTQTLTIKDGVLESGWDNAYIGKKLKFSFTCSSDFDEAWIFFKFMATK